MQPARHVVDADAHYWEPLGEFGGYLDGPWSERLSDRADPGAFLPRSTGDRFMAGRIRREEVSYPAEDMTPDEIPGVMDHLGID